MMAIVGETNTETNEFANAAFTAACVMADITSMSVAFKTNWKANSP
jgi:hypothetical protein